MHRRLQPTLPLPAAARLTQRPRSTASPSKLQLGQSYSLSDLSGGVDVTQYDSGRVFVSLGSPLTGLSAANDYAPNFIASPRHDTALDSPKVSAASWVRLLHLIEACLSLAVEPIPA